VVRLLSGSARRRQAVGVSTSLKSPDAASPVPVAKRLQTVERRTLDRYFQGCITSARIFKLGVDELSRPPKPRETLAKLKSARVKFEHICARLHRESAQCDEAAGRLARLRAAHTLLRAGYGTIEIGSFGGRPANRDEIEKEIRNLESLLKNFFERVEAGNQLLKVRLSAGLRLFLVPEVRSKFRNPDEVVRETTQLVAVLAPFESVLDLVFGMIEENRLLARMLNRKFCPPSRHDGPGTRGAVVNGLSASVRFKLEEILSALVGVRYPFDPPGRSRTIAGFAHPGRRLATHAEDICREVAEAGEKLKVLHTRILARLAAVAEKVEQVAGLKKLLEPSDKGEKTSHSSKPAAA